MIGIDDDEDESGTEEEDMMAYMRAIRYSTYMRDIRYSIFPSVILEPSYFGRHFQNSPLSFFFLEILRLENPG